MLFQITFADFSLFNLFATVEAGLDTLNTFVTSGKEVHSVVMINQHGHRTELPLEVFGGKPTKDSMLEIEAQYKDALVLNAWDGQYNATRAILLKANVSYATQKVKQLTEEHKTWALKTQALLARMDAIQDDLEALLDDPDQ